MRRTASGFASDKVVFTGFFLVIAGAAAAALFLVAAGRGLPQRATGDAIAALVLLGGGTVLLNRSMVQRGGLLEPHPTREERRRYREDYRSHPPAEPSADREPTSEAHAQRVHRQDQAPVDRSRHMAETVADHVLQRLREWGWNRFSVTPVTASTGSSPPSGGLLQPAAIHPSPARGDGSLRRDRVRQVQRQGRGLRRDLEHGAIHLLNGLYDAKLDHVPVVAIVGQTARSAMGGSYQQEIDLQTLYKDVASDYLVEVNVSSQLPNALDRAFRTAMARRSPTAVIIPSDLQEENYEPPQHAFKQVPSSPPGALPSTTLPPTGEIQRAAEVLNAGSKVAILIGQGARGAAEEVIEVAELTGAGVAKALLGKDVLPDDLPFVTGPIGLLGSRPSYELMRDCDTLLIVGSNFPYAQFLPEFGQARAVQIDLDGMMIGMRYPTEVNLVGDAKATLRQLIPMLRRNSDRAWRETVERHLRHWWQTIEHQSMLEAKPVNPMRVVWELSQQIPENAIVTADSGSSANWYARCLRFRGQIRGSLSGTLATMGTACRTRSARNSRTRNGPPSPWWATARCR